MKPLSKQKSEKVKKVRRPDSPNSEDESIFSSVSSRSLTSTIDPEQLKKKAERRIQKITKKLKQKDIPEEVLKTMKIEASKVASKI